MSTPKLRLYTFAISHFSEKARWGLQWANLAFSESQLLPGLHIMTTRRLAPRSSVPILVAGSDVIQGSSAILDYAARHSRATSLHHGRDEKASIELETWCDRAFGTGVQSIGYEALLRDRATMVALWSQASPRLGRAFYRFTYRPIAQKVRQTYVRSAEAAAKSLDAFRTGMDRIDALLASHRGGYLLGDAPTRADLTVAALLAPLCTPPEHPVKWPSLPESLADLGSELQSRPIGQHVRKMYKQHRNQ